MFQRYSFDEVLKILKSDFKKDKKYIFDCDGTLVDGDLSTVTGWLLMRDGLVSPDFIPRKFQDHKFLSQLTLSGFDEIRDEIFNQVGLHKTNEWEVMLQSGIPHDTVV